ncbi:DMT family transporter [Paenalcaligenes hominis]|uniref:DMT family transporter n=1 Tax=Paenalcaligenes hominis TaxID=643674 RepID=UPI0035237525
MRSVSFTPKTLGILSIIFASFLWGTTGVSATFAPDVNALAIGAAAMGIGGLLQAGLAVGSIRQHYSQLQAQRRYYLLGALTVAIYPLAFYSSMRLAGVTIGTVISIGAAPILSFLIEMVMEQARLTRRWLGATALGLTGIIFLCLADNSTLPINPAQTQLTLGIMLGLLAALTYAMYSWAARRLMQQGVPSRAAMGTIFGLGGMLLMPVLFFTGAAFLDSWQNLTVGLYMALIPMFLGYVCFGYGLAHVQSSTAITISLIEPMIAALLAVVIVGERLTSLGWIGITLIIFCLVCITWPNRADKS